MGYDIEAKDNAGKEIAYLRAYMGAFRMCREQGYDWFALIDAKECDCGCSGCGEEKVIKLTDLKAAMRILKSHDTGNRLSSDGRDEWAHRKPLLKEFMQKCIDWCEANNTEGVNIGFY